MEDSLLTALNRQGISLPPAPVAALEQYCRLLWDWNERINLTRHTDFERFVTRDVVDSLALADLLAPGEDVLDVGTGGGVPGVILAIVRPDLGVGLCESVAKRHRAVSQIVTALKLKIPVHHARVEDLLADYSCDTLVARAVAPLSKLLQWLAPHWSVFGRLLVIKGPKWIEERAEARHLGRMQDLQLRKLAQYPLAESGAESVILEIKPKGA